jgi:hypothetical protein
VTKFHSISQSFFRSAIALAEFLIRMSAQHAAHISEQSFNLSNRRWGMWVDFVTREVVLPSIVWRAGRVATRYRFHSSSALLDWIITHLSLSIQSALARIHGAQLDVCSWSLYFRVARSRHGNTRIFTFFFRTFDLLLMF